MSAWRGLLSGNRAAFVDPSGAGKSTVFALIERFYEATGGRVLVDGTDVRDWSLSELRSAIGYVEQGAPALAGTLRENLVFAAPRATELARETTVLVVAHRLSTVTGADRIVVMDAGRLRSVGTHEELVAQDQRPAHSMRVTGCGPWLVEPPYESVSIPARAWVLIGVGRSCGHAPAVQPPSP